MGDTRTVSHFDSTDEGIVSSLSRQERMFLRDVVPLLSEVGTDDDDPAANRLQVPVYLSDPESDQEWWRLMGPEIDQSRNADRAVFERLIGSRSILLSDAEADAVLRVINETRLVIGARLGIEVDEDHDRIPPESRAPLDYLGWLQEELMVELSKRL